MKKTQFVASLILIALSTPAFAAITCELSGNVGAQIRKVIVMSSSGYQREASFNANDAVRNTALAACQAALAQNKCVWSEISVGSVIRYGRGGEEIVSTKPEKKEKQIILSIQSGRKTPYGTSQDACEDALVDIVVQYPLAYESQAWTPEQRAHDQQVQRALQNAAAANRGKANDL